MPPRYDVFVAALDPAWDSDDGGGGRGADEHYETADPRSLAEDIRCSGAWDDFSDALVWMWATPRAFAVGDAHLMARLLCLEVVASFVWVKTEPVTEDHLVHWATQATPSVVPENVAVALASVVRMAARAMLWGARLAGIDLWMPPARMGLGQWQRTEHEVLLVCRRGQIGVPPSWARRRSVICAPRGRHSEKPEEAWRVIESTTTWLLQRPWRGVELFARTQRDGWGAWGRLDGEAAPPRYAP